MNLPPMDPTGAMSSGTYVAYMLNYNNKVADLLLAEMSHYHTADTINDWNVKWTTILSDVSADLDMVEASGYMGQPSLRTMTTQVRMLEDAVGAL